ncbi:MAG: Trm112 family protein [Sphaerospermopsis sp. SIO1G2]|nr:Trm112 family protein [Sphaerospermopsis sp. SIO1G2]
MTQQTIKTESSTINPSLDESLLDILVCPLTKAPLEYNKQQQILISRKAGLAFPVRNGIPILVKEEAQEI